MTPTMLALIKLEAATLGVTGVILAVGATDNDMRIAIGALAGAIIVLFGIVMTAYRNISKKFDITFEKLIECEQDRNDLRKTLGIPAHKQNDPK